MPMTEAPRTDWPLVLLLWGGAGLGSAAQYGKVSVVFDRLPELYPDAGTSLGLAVSLVGLVGVLLGVVAGALVVRLGAGRVLLVALFAGAAISAFQALVLPFPFFLLSRVFEGMAHLGVVVAVPTLIVAATAERHHPIALTLWGTFFGVSFALLNWLGLALVDRFGVPALFWAHAIYMAASAVVLLPRLAGVETTTAGQVSLWEQHLSIYRSPRIGAPALGWLFYTFCFLSLLTLLPPYLDPNSRRWIMGAIPLVSILVSMTLGVALLRRIPAISVVVIGFLCAALVSAVLVLVPGNPILCLLLAAAFGLVQGASYAAVPQLNREPRDMALANGGLSQAGNLGNTLGTPILLAVLMVSGYAGMMSLLAVILVLGAGVHLWLARLRAI